MSLGRSVPPLLVLLLGALLAPWRGTQGCPLDNVPDLWDGAGDAGVPTTFYPFGESEGDTEVTGVFGFGRFVANPEVQMNLEQFRPENIGPLDLTSEGGLPFLGRLESQVTINAYGFVFFDLIESEFNAEFTGDESRGVGAYVTSTPRGESVNGSVYYRITRDTNLLCRASQKIRTYFLDFPEYEAKWMLVVTWRTSLWNNLFDECGDDIECVAQTTPIMGEDEVKTNIFQMVIVTDGRYTFTMFIYGDITWPEPGNFFTFGGSVNVGYTSNDMIPTDYLDSSGVDPLMLDTVDGNFGEQGIVILRIDQTDLPLSGCNTSDTVVAINPTSGSVFGDKTITIVGPCFDETPANIKCRFGDKEVDGTVDDDMIRAYCCTPSLPRLEENQFKLSVDGGSTYPYSARYYAVYDDFLYRVTRQEDSKWFNGSFTSLRISWIPGVLDTTNVNVDLIIMDRNGSSVGNPIPLLQNVLYADGSATLNTSSRMDGPLAYGVIRISPTVDNDCGQRLWSDLHPLNWYFTQTGADGRCQTWINSNNLNPLNVTGVIVPPCTSAIARNDRRFRLDPLCNGITLSSNARSLCRYLHDDKNVTCFIARVDDGLAQQACYGDNGMIIKTGQAGGGIVHSTFAGFGNLFHHLFDDVFPWVSCCDLGSGTNCNTYFNLRNTTSCTGYRPPTCTRTGGDPHFTTFDFQDFTFNGHGEYKLIDSPNFKAQVRNMPVEALAEDATFLRAIVVQRTGSTKVEVGVDFAGALELKVNGDVTIYTGPNTFPTDGTTEISYTNTNITVVYQDGETVTVRVFQGALSALILLPQSYRGTTVGLNGNFDQDISNDLRMKDGTPVAPNPTPQQLFDFGNSWRTEPGESMFDYPPDKSHVDYQDTSYTPTFIEDSTLLALPGGAVCEGNLQCLFDLTVTGDEDFALNTRDEAVEFRELAEMFAAGALPCAPMPCQFGGSCRNINGDTDFECDCPAGTTGSRCETVLFGCSPNPCRYGGTCRAYSGGYYCDCVPGYYGPNCDQLSATCYPNPCRNGGFCRLLSGGLGYRCDCPYGYFGPNCERATPFNCFSNPCKNGGTCSMIDGVERCTCWPGYEGAQCQIGKRDTIVMIIASVTSFGVITTIIVIMCIVILSRRRSSARRKPAIPRGYRQGPLPLNRLILR